MAKAVEIMLLPLWPLEFDQYLYLDLMLCIHSALIAIISLTLHLQRFFLLGLLFAATTFYSPSFSLSLTIPFLSPLSPSSLPSGNYRHWSVMLRLFSTVLKLLQVSQRICRGKWKQRTCECSSLNNY